MVQRLILMRHAKSGWDDPRLDDHARTLNARGTRSARALGDWLRAGGYLPDQALVSDATRTRETFAGLALDVPVRFCDGLYHAGALAMLGALRAAAGQTLLLIGHNPGIGDLAAQILAKAPDHPRFDAYPTCATLIADFPVQSWSDAHPGTAQAAAFIVPRELE